MLHKSESMWSLNWVQVSDKYAGELEYVRCLEIDKQNMA